MKFAFRLLAFVLLLVATSCQKEVGYAVQTEQFTKEFFMELGTIDPDHKFNLAHNASIAINAGDHADYAKVYVEINQRYYRVANLTDVSGIVTVNIDIPLGTTELVVDVDGETYAYTTSGSRAVPDPDNDYLAESRASVLGDNVLGWMVPVELGGSFKDYDYNDMVFRITNETVGSSGNFSKHVTVQAMAAGHFLRMFLHYRNPVDGVDYLIGTKGCTPTAEVNEVDGLNYYEWHTWFGRTTTDFKPSELANVQTSVNVTALCDISSIVPADFTLEDYSRKEYAQSIIYGFYMTLDNQLEANADNYEKKYLGWVFRTTGKRNKNYQAIAAPTNNEAPQMFIIPDAGKSEYGWAWSKEHHHILDSYPPFQQWLTNQALTNWFLYTNDTPGMGKNIETHWMRRSPITPR